MKRPYLIASFLLLALAACHRPLRVVEPAETPSPELSSIDSLMWTQPDSALMRLLPYFDTCRDVSGNVSTAETHDGHYANLLLAELLYKNDYAQTNRPALRQAVAYFDSLVQAAGKRDASAKTVAFLDARAHYIHGVGYYENDSAVPACREYLKALEIIEGRFEEKEMVGKKAKFMALTYTHVEGLFSDYYLHEQALYFGKMALKYYRKYDATPWHIAWILEEMGAHYDMMDNYDSAGFYYHKSLMVLPDTNNLTFRDIATHIAFLSYKTGKSPMTSLNRLRQLSEQSVTKKELLSRYAIVGEIYYHEKKFDSAWVYLNRVFQECESINSKKQAAEWLMEICKIQDKLTKVFEYADFLVPFANLNENHSHLKSQLTEHCNEYEQKRLEIIHQKSIEKNHKKVNRAIGLLFGIIIVVTILYLVNNKRHQSLVIRHKDTEKLLEAERHSHKMQQAALAGRLKRSNSALKVLKTTQEVTVPKDLQQQKPVGNYADEAICRHILMVCNNKHNPIKSTVPVSAYTNIALDDAQKAQLKQAATRYYGELFEKLKEQHPELKDKDLLYCYLCLLGLDNVQIAVLLQHSSSTIWEREKRLQKIFGSNDKIAILLHGIMTN